MGMGRDRARRAVGLPLVRETLARFYNERIPSHVQRNFISSQYDLETSTAMLDLWQHKEPVEFDKERDISLSWVCSEVATQSEGTRGLMDLHSIDRFCASRPTSYR